ncbi:putative reverse transcriptase domain-containing protein [Tanacetum coccineum]
MIRNWLEKAQEEWNAEEEREKVGEWTLEILRNQSPQTFPKKPTSLAQERTQSDEFLKMLKAYYTKQKLYAKFSKCEFWLQEVHFLGHVVNQSGIHVEPGKIEAVKNWKSPMTPSEIQSFLGLAEKLHGLNQQMERKEDESLYFMDRIWVPLAGGARTIIMNKAHKTKPSGLLQQPEIPEWKWDKITMDFITKLPKTNSGHDTIWVIVDRMTKTAHFLAMREDYSTDKLARLYIDEIVARHGVPVSIISNQDGLFTSRCWETVQKALGTRLDMSTTYHPQTDGQSERTIQNLEDMLRACVIDFALYGRKCRSPVLWAEIGENSLIGPELVQETTDKVVLIKEKLKAARDRQKSYADNRRKPLEFEVGDRVLLKVSPWKGVIHFGKRGKLAPRYVGPFEILERIGPVAYRLRLPEELSSVHDTFHVSNLKKCLADANLQVPLNEIKIDKTLRFVEEPVKIMDREIRSLKRSKISLVKVRWNSKRGPEFTWEREDHMKSKYPQLFVDRAVESAS